jgi:hypothetical protein
VFEGKLISTGSSYPKLLRGIIFKALLRVKVAITQRKTISWGSILIGSTASLDQKEVGACLTPIN